MIRVTYQADSYAPERVLKRYVSYRIVEGEFFFCEVGEDRRYDLRQGYVDATHVPLAIRITAYGQAGFYPPYVEWPFMDIHELALD